MMDNGLFVAWLTLLLLAVNAVLFAWYLWETRKMRQAADKQVNETQELVRVSQDQLGVGQRQVDAAQKQLAVSQEQVAISQAEAEAQITPALVVAISNERAPNGTAIPRVLIRNVGSGPALNLRKYEVSGEAPITWSGNSVPKWDLEGSFVAARHFLANPAYPEDWKIRRDEFAGSNRKMLHLVYQSLSEKDYASVIEFNVQGQPLSTRFEKR